jgi:hypothetical protein
MDYEAILESARDLAYEWCAIYVAMSNRTTHIVRFQCGTFEYLYDDYASLEVMGRVPYDPVIEAGVRVCRDPGRGFEREADAKLLERIERQAGNGRLRKS